MGVPWQMAKVSSTSVGPSGRRAQPLEVRARQLAPRPQRGLQGHAVEELAVLDARADLVVVAADGDQRLERAHHVDGLVRVRAVAHEVAEEDALVPGLAAHEREDGGEGLLVRVDVREDQVLHPSVAPPPSSGRAGRPPRRCAPLLRARCVWCRRSGPRAHNSARDPREAARLSHDWPPGVDCRRRGCARGACRARSAATP